MRESDRRHAPAALTYAILSEAATLEHSGNRIHRGEATSVRVVAGVDLGGTAVNYTLIDGQEQFLIEGLCEHPAAGQRGA